MAQLGLRDPEQPWMGHQGWARTWSSLVLWALLPSLVHRLASTQQDRPSLATTDVEKPQPEGVPGPGGGEGKCFFFLSVWVLLSQPCPELI